MTDVPDLLREEIESIRPDLACTVLATIRFGWLTILSHKQCPHPAEWIATARCPCGNRISAAMCEVHRDGVSVDGLSFGCRPCGTRADTRYVETERI